MLSAIKGAIYRPTVQHIAGSVLLKKTPFLEQHTPSQMPASTIPVISSIANPKIFQNSPLRFLCYRFIVNGFHQSYRHLKKEHPISKIATQKIFMIIHCLGSHFSGSDVDRLTANRIVLEILNEKHRQFTEEEKTNLMQWIWPTLGKIAKEAEDLG